MKCPNCQANIPDSLTFCDRCGHPLVAGAQSSYYAMNKDPGAGASDGNIKLVGNSGPTVITRMVNSGGVLLSVVALVVLVVWFGMYQNGQQAQASAEATRNAQVALATQTAVGLHAGATSTVQAVEKAYARGVAEMELENWPTAQVFLGAVLEEAPDYRDTTDRMKTVIAAQTPTATATTTETPTPVPSATATDTPIPTGTYTPEPTPTATDTPAPTATATATHTPTITPTPTITDTPGPTATATRTPSATPTPTITASPTVTPTPTITETPAAICVTVTALGVGFAPTDETNAARRERFAIMAAEADAKRVLAQWINGSEVEAITVVNDGVYSEDGIRILVQARVPGTDTSSQSYDPVTGRAVVYLVIRIDQNGQTCPEGG